MALMAELLHLQFNNITHTALWSGEAATMKAATPPLICESSCHFKMSYSHTSRTKKSAKETGNSLKVMSFIATHKGVGLLQA